MNFIRLTKSRKFIPIICELLAAGEVVAAPTETAYGLLADATNYKAVKKLLKLKGDRGIKPIPVVVSNLIEAKKWAKFNKVGTKLALKFWPGPLTLILPAKGKLVSKIISQDKTIGLRVPGDKWLRSLLAVYGSPLTATSANISGGATPYTATAVLKSLKSRGLMCIVDSGQLPRRTTSTIVQIKKGQLNILRPGAITASRLNRVVK